VTVHLDHLLVPSRNKVASAKLLVHSITEELRLLVFFAPAEGTGNAVDDQRR